MQKIKIEVINIRDNLLSANSSKEQLVGMKILDSQEINVEYTNTDEESIIYDKLNRLVNFLSEHCDHIISLNCTYLVIHRMISGYIKKNYSDQPIENRTFVAGMKDGRFIENFKQGDFEDSMWRFLNNAHGFKYLNYLHSKLFKSEALKEFTKNSMIIIHLNESNDECRNTIELCMVLKNTKYDF